MASGDTKTESLLNILGNGGSIEGISGCANTKTQNYIIDAINRIQNVENEVEKLKNNPDVVDIVDTYADLQAYDTSTLTDKDIIRVLEDSTHDNCSTYYRWNATTNQFDYIGEAGGGGDGGGLVTFYSTVDLSSAANKVSLYSDKACTNVIQTSAFFQAIRSGKTVSIEYGGSGDFDNRQIHKIIEANITNVDTTDAYDEVGPSATYFVGNGTKRIYPANPDPTSTNGFSIS